MPFAFLTVSFMRMGRETGPSSVAGIGLKLIGANPENLFAAFTFGLSHIFLFPFEGLIGSPAIGGAVLELSSLIAMVVYALLAWAFERLIWLLFYRPRETEVGITQTTTSEQVPVIQTTTTSESDPVIQTTTTREAYRE